MLGRLVMDTEQLWGLGLSNLSTSGPANSCDGRLQHNLMPPLCSAALYVCTVHTIQYRVSYRQLVLDVGLHVHYESSITSPCHSSPLPYYDQQSLAGIQGR